MRVVLVILTLQFCMGVASALFYASVFRIMFFISRRSPIQEEQIQSEIVAWLDWLKETYPDQIGEHQDVSVQKMRTRIEIKFNLMHDESIEDLPNFFTDAYNAYDKFTIFESAPNVQWFHYTSLFGDPHVSFEYGGLKLCYDSKEGPYDVVTQFHRKDLGVMLNIDFDPSKNERRAKKGKMEWIQDAAILSPQMNVIIHKKFMKVHNNIDDSENKVKWSHDESFEVGNTDVYIKDKKVKFYMFASNDSLTPEVGIEIVRPGAGLTIHIMNNENDVGYIGSLKKNIVDVAVVNDTAATLTTDSGDIPLVNHKGKCWKIPNGGRDVFPENTFEDFIRNCLDCE